jgi:hypothetical protein
VQRVAGVLSAGPANNAAEQAVEGGPMSRLNNPDRAQLKTNWKHMGLVGLHVIVVVLSALSDDFRTADVAPTALPQAFQPWHILVILQVLY